MTSVMADTPETLSDVDIIAAAYSRWTSRASTVEIDSITKTIQDHLPQKTKLPNPDQHLDLQSLVIPRALALLDKPLPKNPTQVRRENRKNIRRRTTEGTEQVSEQSGILKLGTSAHKIIETIYQNPSKAPVETLGYSLSLIPGTDSHQVSGVEFSKYSPRYKQPDFFVSKEIDHEPSPILLFSAHPTDSPDQEDIVTWTRNKLRSGLSDLKSVFGKLPSTPYEMELALQDQKTNRMLTRITENFITLVGPDSWAHMGLTVKEGNTIKVSLVHDSEFPLLNLLSLSRLISDPTRQPVDSRTVLFSEIPVGNCAITNGRSLTLRGGIVDLLSINLESDMQNHPIFTHFTSGQIIDSVATRFGSQIKKYHQFDPDTGGFHTRLPRNVLSLANEIWSLFGYHPAFLKALQLHITDFKFLAGDGGWSTAYNRDLLPVPEHKKQLEEYLFLLLAQLARLDKRIDRNNLSALGSQNQVGVSLDRIVDFAFSNGVFANITGELSYELPDSSQKIAVTLPESPEKLHQLGEEIIQRRVRDATTQADSLIVRAIASLLSKAPEKTVKVPKDAREIPQSLKSVCFEYQGVNYLNLQELVRADFHQANYFSEEKCYQLWTNQFGSPLRLSVDTKRGRFNLAYEGTHLSGNLITDIGQKGVYQNSDSIIDTFTREIWQQIPVNKNGKIIKQELPSQANLTIWVDDEGNEYKYTVGKPVVCRLDPLSNTWRLDPKLFDQVLQENSGKAASVFRLHQLSDTLKLGREGDVLCPLPFHPPPRKNTPSAHFYPQKKEANYIHCFRCNHNISIPGKTSFLGEVRIHLPPPENIADFKNIPPTRRLVSETVMELSEVFLAHSPVAQDYLRRRGIDPAQISQIGYLPCEIIDFLVELVDDQIYHKSHGTDSVRLDSFSELSDQLDHQLAFVDDILDKQLISSRLNIGFLKRLRSSGIIRGSEEKGASSRAGGRIVAPLYWIDTYSNGPQLVISELYGRAVKDSDGHSLAPDPAHFKFPPVPEGVDYDESSKKWSYRAPSGFWLSAPPDKFMLRTFEHPEVVVVEAPIDGISLGKIVPEYADRTLAICGSKPGFLVPFLKFLGVRRVILGTDFDDPGQEASNKITKLLSRSGFTCSTINHILQSIIPNLTEITGNPPDKIKDINELLTSRFTT